MKRSNCSFLLLTPPRITARRRAGASSICYILLPHNCFSNPFLYRFCLSLKIVKMAWKFIFLVSSYFLFGSLKTMHLRLRVGLFFYCYSCVCVRALSSSFLLLYDTHFLGIDSNSEFFF
jgi:hypothetical protein